MEGNLKKKVHKNHDILHKILFKAAKAYTDHEFKLAFDDLCKMGPCVRKFLTEDMPIEKWAAVYVKHNRCQAITSNIAESMNSRKNESKEIVSHCINGTAQGFVPRMEC